MSQLQDALDDYLTIRRQLGFKLENDGRLLAEFVAFVDHAGHTTVTTQLAVAWARQPVGVKPHRWRQRLGMVRRLPGTSPRSTRTRRSRRPICCLPVSSGSRPISIHRPRSTR